MNKIILKESNSGKILFSNHVTVSELVNYVIDKYGYRNVKEAIRNLSISEKNEK